MKYFIWAVFFLVNLFRRSFFRILISAFALIIPGMASAITGVMHMQYSGNQNVMFSVFALQNGCGAMQGSLDPGQSSADYTTPNGNVACNANPGFGYMFSGGDGSACVRFSTVSFADANTKACVTIPEYGYSTVYSANGNSTLYAVVNGYTSCPGTQLNWGPGNSCSASVATGNSGAYVSITNSKAGAAGTATAYCSGSSWAIQNPICSANLAAPTSISATDGTVAGQVVVTWGAVANASGYDLQYRRQGESSWVTVPGVGSGWQLGTAEESVFEFRVAAKNAAGQGTWSGVDTGYIARSCGTATLNWGAGNFCAATASSGPAGTARALTNVTAGATGSATATCNGVTGQWSLSGDSCSASLAAPTSISATDGTVAGKVTVTWGAVANATGYDLQYRKQGDVSWTTAASVNSGWQLSTADTSVFEFRVAGKNALGQGTWSGVDTGYIARSCGTATLNWGAGNFCAATASSGPEGTIRTLTNATAGATGSATATCNGVTGQWSLSGGSCSANLAAPTSISATDGTVAGKVTVTWGAVTYASGYDIQYRRQGDASWTTVAGVGSGWQLSTTDESVFEFKVAAKNVVGQGTWSGVDTGYIARSCGTATLNWGAGNFCAATASSGPAGTIRTLTNVTGGASGGATATCNGVTGQWSLSGGSCSANLAAPTSISATDGTVAGKVTVTWGAVTYASGYDIQYRRQGESSWVTVAGVSSGWQLSTADESVFEFRVAANNAAGQGVWSGVDTGYIARSCATTTLNWGPSNFCAVSASSGPAGTIRTLTNATAGATGSATATCNGVTGQWNLSGGTCTVSLADPTTLFATQGSVIEAVKVTWSPTPGASRYDLQYRKSGEATWSDASNVSSDWLLAVSDISDYEFRLRAANVLGVSGWSGVVTGWAQRCDATTLSWGVQNICKSSVPRTLSRGSDALTYLSVVTSQANGTVGQAGTYCANGAWNVNFIDCSVNMTLDATDGTREDDVKLTWTMAVTGLTGVSFNVYRGEGTEAIATNLKPLEHLDPDAERGKVFAYRVDAYINDTKIGTATNDGHIPACRAARLVGASLNADMSAINGVIEQWSCLNRMDATREINTLGANPLSVTGGKIYKAFSVPVPESLKDGAHILHIGLKSDGVVLNAQRMYDVPFQLDRASISVNDLTITYDGAPAKSGQEASSIGRFGIRMEGGNGIGFAEELK